MGIIKRFSKALKGKPEDPEIKATRMKAYREGRLKRAQKEGYAEGLGKPAKKGNRGAGWLPAIEHSLGSAEKTFGFKGGGMGTRLDDDISLAGTSLNVFQRGTQKPKPLQQKVTRITKSGTIIITEPAQKSMKKQKIPRDIWEDIDQDNPF